MTGPVAALQDCLHTLGVDLDGDFLRDGITLLTRLLTELEIGERLGAERYQRTEQGRTHRNGGRERMWETRVGEVRCASPSYEGVFTFPVSWRRSGERNGPCWRRSRPHPWRVSAHGEWTTWSRPVAESCALSRYNAEVSVRRDRLTR